MLRRVGVLYRNPSKVGPYLSALALVGLEVVPVMPGEVKSSKDFSGLLLTGGTDVDPSLYKQVPSSKTQPPDRERDDFEIALTTEAIREDLPVLAICRGMQLLNVMYGGRLIQDLPDSGISHAAPPPAGAEPGHHPAVHSVEHRNAGLLPNVFQSRLGNVNSRHHQAVERPGEGILVIGRAADGVIESCALIGHRFVVGVQWHPEDRVLVDDTDRRLFEAFAAAAQQS